MSFSTFFDLNTLIPTLQQYSPTVDELRAAHATAHPSIEPILKWAASPALAAMALARAIHGGKRAQLGFIALAAGSMTCFFALLWETRMGSVGDDTSTILSFMSSIAWAAVPVLLLFRVNPDNLLAYVFAALSSTTSGVYILVQHASKPLDEVASTAASTLAAAAVVAWTRQTGFWRMIFMAGAWAMIVVPQYGFHGGDALQMDMARFGALLVAFILATAGIDDDKDNRDEIKISADQDKPANSNQADDQREAA
jgi:hypothetical protein